MKLTTTIVSPTGTQLSLIVAGNTIGAPPNTNERRRIGSNTVGREQPQVVGGGYTDSVDTNYSVVNACAMIEVRDHTDPPTAWSNDVSTLFAGLSVSGSDVALALPPGWIPLGAGPIRTTYFVSFDANIDGTTKRASLQQMPQASLGATAAQYELGHPTPTTFQGQPAWLGSRATGGIVYLAWEHSGVGTILIGYDGISFEQLKTLADQLTTHQGTAWAKALGTGNDAAPTADTTPPFVTPAANCAVNNLTISRLQRGAVRLRTQFRFDGWHPSRSHRHAD